MIPIVNSATKLQKIPKSLENASFEVMLCDLTHVNNGQLSSNVFPLGVGLIGAYLLNSDIGSNFDVELFKYPSELGERLSSKCFPAVIGFANYSWTLEISVSFARLVREVSPQTIIIFGGPNYGLSNDELENFWTNYGDCVDFNIVMEGERAFYLLLRSLLLNGFDKKMVKENYESLKNVHFQDRNKKIIKSDLLERLNIDELPSPYLDTKLMEKFFDGKLIPLTHSTRGCPFKCTFCSEGADYYNKVKQRTARIYEEYKYIAQRAVSANVYDLMLSDANYGMFKEDSVRSSELAKVQAEFGYPKSVFVSTGKNQKDRVLSVVKKLGGAVQLSASLQTTSEEVLQNIERSNISIEVLASAAQEASENEVASYSELILGLPGETLTTHMKSILDVADAGFSNIRIYQLILLPQTPLNTTEMRKQYGFLTKVRPMPRSYGIYGLPGNEKGVVEYEEIVIQTNALSYDEYSNARKIGLLVELIHNGKIFYEINQLLTFKNARWSDFLGFLFSKVISVKLPDRLSKIFSDFIDMMSERLYESKESLAEYLSGVEAQDVLVRLTTNELASTKANIILLEFDLLNTFVYSSLIQFLEIQKIDISINLIEHFERFSILSKAMPFDHGAIRKFTVNLPSNEKKIFIQCIGQSKMHYPSCSPTQNEFLLKHDDEQIDEITRILNLYGDNEEGHGRIVMRSPILQRYFRRVHFDY
jgi:radical SAM superfamily enzyme YgiQ (UPF0313 family)